MASNSIVCFSAFLFLALATTSSSQLSPYYYDYLCPEALPIIQRVVETAIHKERRMGASLLRLHFHDCFVNGCDGSILLDSTSDIDGEKNARPNANSARGFEVVDQIKSEVDKACGGPVVSCADILAVAARDSVVALGGPTWVVQLGRRDSTTASKDAANNDIPSPFMELPALISNFKKQGLNAKDLVALSGAHTIGLAQCLFFKNRIHNDTNVDPNFAAHLRTTACPLTPDNTLTGTNKNLSPLDSTTPEFFDASYFNDLVNKKGLLHSDQALFGGGYTGGLVRAYSSNAGLFWADFAHSMIKMGNIKVLTGNQGEVRLNCRKVN